MAYSTRSDLELIFGKSNLDKWADLNNAEVATEIAARITWAISLADERIDDRLRDGIYDVPLVTSSRTIIDVSARLAACFLYMSRGLIDPEDTAKNQLKMHQDYAESQLNDILAGRIRIDATRRNTTTYPTTEIIDA